MKAERIIKFFDNTKKLWSWTFSNLWFLMPEENKTMMNSMNSRNRFLRSVDRMDSESVHSGMTLN